MILLAGVWISRYLGRSALVWAFNEGVTYPRRIGQAVRVVAISVTVVVAADRLNTPAANAFMTRSRSINLSSNVSRVTVGKIIGERRV
jgi:hypothetical protein